jgi:hypothetical protein
MIDVSNHMEKQFVNLLDDLVKVGREIVAVLHKYHR